MLVLLLLGLLQPVASAYGFTCALPHSPVQAAPLPDDATSEHSAGGHEGHLAISAPHQHDSVPQPDLAVTSATTCSVAAIPSEQRLPKAAATARRVLQISDLPPASLFIPPLFHPPRLS